jgi:HSP20 family molecular chaperone IbpA
LDFLFIPESESNLKFNPKDKKIRAFKISYHFETGMEKPEIKFEGDIDDKKIQEYLKNVDLSKNPSLKKLFKAKSIEEIDANKLSLSFTDPKKNLSITEPQTEINDYKDKIEIVLDIPGIREDDVKIDIIEGGTKLIFNAANNNRRYMKDIFLPFEVSTNDYEIEVKNGLAIILVNRLEK